MALSITTRKRTIPLGTGLSGLAPHFYLATAKETVEVLAGHELE